MNCNNGLFATGLSERNINLIVESPVMKQNHTIIHANEHMYKVPLFVEDHAIDLIVCFDDDSFTIEDE